MKYKKLDLLVLVPSNSKSAAGRDKLAELIARKLMKKQNEVNEREDGKGKG